MFALPAAVMACRQSPGSCIHFRLVFEPDCRAAVPFKMTDDVGYDRFVGVDAILARALWTTLPLFIRVPHLVPEKWAMHGWGVWLHGSFWTGFGSLSSRCAFQLVQDQH